MTKIISLSIVLLLATSCTQAQKDAAGSDLKAGENAGLACGKADFLPVIGEVAGALSSGDYTAVEAKVTSDLFACAAKAIVAVFDGLRNQVTASPTTASAPPTKLEVNARAYLASRKIK